MSDPAYMTGFENEIVDVHFGGGDWILIYAFPAVHDNAATDSNITAAFPALTGGTPGVQVLIHNNGRADFHTGFPYTVTAKDVANTVKTASTKVFHSFGVKKREAAPTGDSGTPADYIMAFIQIDPALKKAGSFIMRTNISITDPNGSFQPLSIGTFREKTIKAGFVVPDNTTAFSSIPGIVGFVDAVMDPSDPSWDFLIDPKTLSVTWL